MLLFTVGLVILGTLVMLCVSWEVRTSGVMGLVWGSDCSDAHMNDRVVLSYSDSRFCIYKVYVNALGMGFGALFRVLGH